MSDDREGVESAHVEVAGPLVKVAEGPSLGSGGLLEVLREEDLVPGH